MKSEGPINVVTYRAYSSWRSIRRSPIMGIGMGIAGLVLLVALLSPWLTINDPVFVQMSQRLRAPSMEYPLGTDHLGRCILSRLVAGTRQTVGLSFCASAVVMIIGVPIGLIAGFAKGFLDALLMRLADAAGAVPEFLLAIAVAGFLGPGLVNTILAIACVKWIGYARLVRGIAISECKKDYIHASIVAGSGGWAIIRRHLLRQMASPLAIMAAADVGKTILLISALSYLGLGAQPPSPEWGAMLSDGRPYFQIAPEQMIYPGLCIMIIVLACNLVSDGLRDLMDVRAR
ncbi:nickel transporter permease [Paenibacillus sp. UMB4589-SE434]|uniref:nickel transporter permease n=1 Tax=Paenibacillus sp. UMB4589-SE434 TaxID=3046314 RepID=UPI00254C2CD2|nr:nickel transporter permease [Paenibacillus sp. UMB4589-SE434]MDK8180230.1 ABC transporter permease subunit [Paenibacillus sp. UMB4589-SE434]